MEITRQMCYNDMNNYIASRLRALSLYHERNFSMANNNYIEIAEETTLPALPLRGTVAFPAVQLNLEILRPASLRAFGAAAQSDGLLFLTAQKDPTDENPTPAALYKSGTICRIRHVAKNPEGHLTVTLEGICRANATAYATSKGFFRAKLIRRDVRLGSNSGARAKALCEELFALLDSIKEHHPSLTDEMILAARALQTPGELSDFIASGVLLHFQSKQQILECLNPVLRLERLCTLIEQETEFIRSELDIRRRTRERIDEQQRDYFLREQIKVIQQELGEDADEIEEYAQKIDALACSDEIKRKLNKELSRLEKTPFGAAESTVLRNYLDVCTELPFGKYSEESFTVEEASNVLDADHDGLRKVKDRILEYVAVRQLSPNVKNQIICLVGPPGVGKTSIALSVAKALKRANARISLGGIRDESDIRGHRKTYVAAMPGRIAHAITEAQSMNPVLILDEIDKLSSSVQGDPASALLEVLDPEQNKSFRDHFLEFPLDLSDCLFIATANRYDGIPAPLLDRMEIIELPSYTRTEKLAIAKNHLLPKQLSKHGMEKRRMRVTDEAYNELIDFYTREAGVRSLERLIASLCRKTARKIAEGACKSMTIKAQTVRELLGPRKYFEELPEDTDPIGVVNGLAYTSVGGDLLKVEVAVMDGTGKIETTGSLGDVMKESAHIAVSYVRSVAKHYGIDSEFYKNKDIHIHFPEGAIPKDGPSAGVTMITALVSALTGRAVRRDVAMTGEASLRGRVLPIGGLREKTLAAYRAGIKTVLVPIENKRDLEELDTEARANLCFVFCKHIEEVLENALLEREDAKACEDVRPPAIPLTSQSIQTVTATSVSG